MGHLPDTVRGRAGARRILIAATAALALALAACGGDGGESGDAGGGEAVMAADVAIADFEYDPDPVTLQAGGTITWTNEDTAAHTATSDPDAAPAEFDTGALEQGDSDEVALDEPGTYEYVCSFHATMGGTVEVVE